MKSLLRNTLVGSFGLYLLSQVLAGVTVTGGIFTFLFAGFILSILTFIVQPVLSLITLPLNIITFGLFSFIINAIILYLLTVFVADIKITSFVFQGLSFYGFVIPKITLNILFAYLVCAFVLSFIIGFVKWLMK